ncbi:MAG: 3-deoxy-D-manno-octulosonic acid transferase [Bacteroidaceae bacterium]|nr:3-deoxy-D-manno-octulosonic acid transferase [Bacteroidaceae bacterium]MBO4593345.1 3-deoxy-D-manno-octulosonic acid transferase [Bacteroidaceae bacterium]MBR4782779.1 3-deoxy-D-manno-octulosonic acid transferase [Bacteroidaceae bacterium]
MYSLAIYLYMFCANIVAIFNRKARQLMVGHSQTYDIMRRGIHKGDDFIWFHAASLGEFEQGRPLIEKIRQEHPEYKILLTFFSPSGYEVRKDYKGADVICYLPFDTKLNARKFLRIAQPKMAFFIKYEFWQNYLTALHRRNIPVYSVASIFRPKQIFFRWYGHKYRNVLRTFAHLFVQNQDSVDLLKTLGITNTTIVGDTRMDRVLQIRSEAKELPLCEAFTKTADNTLVAGSTWQPDEDIIIDYFNRHPEQRLIIAPHVVSESHLAEIEGKLQRPALRYSQATADSAATAHCLIIDCYGLLSSIYRYATVAYVGGGFGVGIHNVPEAAVYGLPVIIGPNNQRFREARDLIQLGGCFEIHNAEEYESIIQRLNADSDFLSSASTASADYIRNNSGAVELIYNHIWAPK